MEITKGKYERKRMTRDRKQKEGEKQRRERGNEERRESRNKVYESKGKGERVASE